MTKVIPVPPPRSVSELPIIHRIKQLYQEICRLGKKVSKRDRFGLYARVENVIIEILTLAVTAALQTKAEKILTIRTLRREIEVSKHLIRMAQEIGVIEEKTYLTLQSQLQEISRMASGWEKYLNTEKEPSQLL